MVVNCQQVWKEISNYIEGDVDAGLRVAMDEHFGTCTRCKSLLEGARNVVQLYGDERMIEVPGLAGSCRCPRLDYGRIALGQFTHGAASAAIGTRTTWTQYTS
jgi:hypothetical protein